VAIPSLRRAVASDAAALAAIAERAYAPYVPRIGLRPAPMDTDYARAVEQDEVWVADVDGVPAGLVVLRASDDDLLLENVAVDPAYQGQGVGRALLDLVEERAGALDLGSIRLYTHVLMTENQRIYERRGYVETHRQRERGFERVFYRKDLGGRTP
jgi:ribosomal protein S18 acetylase RimI-like enzyme